MEVKSAFIFVSILSNAIMDHEGAKFNSVGSSILKSSFLRDDYILVSTAPETFQKPVYYYSSEPQINCISSIWNYIPLFRISSKTISINLWFVLIGMTIGLEPVIGISLPFFSYGGSSFGSFTILLFIYMKLDAYRLQILR